MACKAGQFQAQTGNNAQAITGIGFKPKAIIIWGTNQTANGPAPDRMVYVGMASGSAAANQRVSANVSTDNVATSACKRYWGAEVIAIFTNGSDAAPVRKATLTSFDTNGFTVTWSGNTTQYVVNYLAIAGDDLTNYELVESTMSTSTGNVNYDIHAFQPDFCFFLSSNGTETVGTTTAGEGFSFGCMKSATERAALSFCSVSGATMASTINSESRNNSIALTGVIAGTGGIDYIVDFNAWRSLGFTWNQSDAPAAANRFASLALKGGSYTVVGGDTKSVDNAPPVDETITMATSFTPECAIVFGRASTSYGTGNADGYFIIGAATKTDGTEEVCAGVYLTDTVTTQADSSISKTKLYSDYSQGVGGPTLTAECDMKTFASGSWVVTWTTNDTGGRKISYIGIATGTQSAGR